MYGYRFDTGIDVVDLSRQLSLLARAALDAADPYADLYYYFCYEIGKNSFADSPDTMVFLSRAFKFMQKRANEIEDNSLREQFMQNPTWNSRLFRAARQHMLI
jgi:hypothetical protein